MVWYSTVQYVTVSHIILDSAVAWHGKVSHLYSTVASGAGPDLGASAADAAIASLAHFLMLPYNMLHHAAGYVTVI